MTNNGGTPCNVCVKGRPSSIYRWFSSATTGSARSITKGKVPLNFLRPTFTAHTNGSNIFDAQAVFNHSPVSKLRPNGNSWMDFRAMLSLLHVSRGPRTILAACTATLQQYGSKTDCFSPTIAANATGWAKSIRPPSFTVFLEKSILNDNPTAKLCANGWWGILCRIRSRRRYTPTCYRQVVHLALLRLLGCVPPILLAERGKCYGE